MESNPILLCTPVTRRFEGLHLKPYLCPAGVATIGFGATFYEDGTRVTLRDPAITPERAEALLQHELRRLIPVICRLCTTLPELGPGVMAAILDFTFNLGSGRLQASTLRRRLNAGDVEGAKVELMKWVVGGGRVLRGLVLRREADCVLMG